MSTAAIIFVFEGSDASVQSAFSAMLDALWAQHRRSECVLRCGHPGSELYGGLHHADKLIAARRQNASLNAWRNR